MPVLLGLILATGNVLNAGTNRGQADGFDIESILKLDGVKDCDGNDLKHFILGILLRNEAGKAEKLLRELAPVMRQISRRMAKDPDGTERVVKTLRVSLEDFDPLVSTMHSEFMDRSDAMQMVLSYFEDPADPFKFRMPGDFSGAKEAIDNLMMLRDRAKNKFVKLLAWYKVTSMKSSDFFILWDNFLIPADRVLGQSGKIRKELVVPAFCQNMPPNLDDMLVLWDWTDAEAAVKAKAYDRKRRRPVGERWTAKRGDRGRSLAARMESVRTGAP